MKFFKIIIELIYWFLIFLSPFLIGGIAFVLLLLYNHKVLAIIALSIGFIMGVCFAEIIRRKYGCSVFIGRLLATPDFYPNEAVEIEDKSKKKNT